MQSFVTKGRIQIMIPLRWHRVFLVFAAVSVFIGLVDEICIWLLPPQAMRQMITGLTTGAVVMLLAYRGGSIVRFVLGGKLGTSDLHAKLDSAMSAVRLSKPIRYRVVLYKGKNPSAFTISDGGECCIFMSSAMASGLSAGALACVIAHECGHMIERHPRKQFIILGLLACVKATTGITIAAIFMVILAYLYMLREWEFIADKHAAEIVGADCVVSAFNEFRALSGEKDISRLSEFMCSHPSLNRRIAALAGGSHMPLRS